MTLTNLKRLIYQKTLRCKIVDIYKDTYLRNNIKNRVYNYKFVILVSETEHILIDEKNVIDLTIYFTRYVHSKSIKIPSLHYNELLRKTILDKVLDKIKETISFTKFDDTKILIDTDVKFSDYI